MTTERNDKELRKNIVNDSVFLELPSVNDYTMELENYRRPLLSRRPARSSRFRPRIIDNDLSCLHTQNDLCR